MAIGPFLSAMWVMMLSKKTIKIPLLQKKGSKTMKQRCAIVNAYATELFAMSGWENIVCFDENTNKLSVNTV